MPAVGLSHTKNWCTVAYSEMAPSAPLLPNIRLLSPAVQKRNSNSHYNFMDYYTRHDSVSHAPIVSPVAKTGLRFRSAIKAAVTIANYSGPYSYDGP